MVYSEATLILARPLILAAGILGTIQALCWTILSIISICFYNDAITTTEDPSSYGFSIYFIFLAPSTTTADGYIVTPTAFNIFMYFYMVLSFIWLILSGFLIWVITRNKWSKSLNIVIFWIVTVVITSILDIILMSLIAADLNKYDNDIEFVPVTIPTQAPEDITDPTNVDITPTPSISSALKTITLASFGIVMTVAARGYVLWLVNVIFAAVLAFIAIRMHQEDRPSLLPFIDAYATGPPQTQFDTSKGNINNGYQHDDSGIFSRGQSLAHPYNKSHQQRLSNNPLASNYNNIDTSPVRPSVESNFSFSRPIERRDPPPKVAKIGKFGVGKKSPSQNVAPPNVPPINGPYIPEPDYSPPGSPTKGKPTKSALRPKSNYVL